MPQPNMQQMLKQVQKMQADMMAAQEQLKNEVVEASAGGGMVTVKVTGDLEVKDIRIDPSAVDPEDVELLQDMVLAATNEALRAAQELASSKMGGLTGGLDLGSMGLPGLGGPGGPGGLPGGGGGKPRFPR
jgi:DNA-binding YbaB/EbfC family protein